MKRATKAREDGDDRLTIFARSSRRTAGDYETKYKWVAITVTTVGSLMSTLDSRILVLGLPTVTRDLSASIEQGIWVTQAYLFASTVSLMIIGRTADVVGRVKLYNAGFAVFTIGSAFSAISLSPTELIVGRVIQGVGAGMLSANALAIVTDAAPTSELGKFISFNQVAARAGSITGYVMTGFILSFTTWRALFLINVPIGIFGTIWAHLRLKELATKDVIRKVDWPGFVTITSSLVLILLAITFLGYGFSELPASLAMLISGLILLFAFIIIERRSVAPLLDLNLLKVREFTLGNVSNSLNALGWNSMLYMISFYLQVIRGLSPLQAAFGVLPLEAVFVVVGPLSGNLADKYGSRFFTILGPIISAISCFYIVTFTASTSYPFVAVAIGGIGAGIGLFNVPNARSIVASVPPNRRGIAVALRSTLVNFAATLGPGVSITLMTLLVPYQTITALLYGAGTANAAGIEQFISGFRLAVAAIGIVFSAEAFFSYSRWEGKEEPQPMVKP